MGLSPLWALLRLSKRHSKRENSDAILDEYFGPVTTPNIGVEHFDPNKTVVPTYATSDDILVDYAPDGPRHIICPAMPIGGTDTVKQKYYKDVTITGFNASSTISFKVQMKIDGTPVLTMFSKVDRNTPNVFFPFDIKVKAKQIVEVTVENLDRYNADVYVSFVAEIAKEALADDERGEG